MARRDVVDRLPAPDGGPGGGIECTEPHEQEAYALVDFTVPGTENAPEDVPEGACAERLAPYVGVDYRDSELYFTYLLPSARGWEQDGDRTTVCFITTTGAPLTQSVAGTGWCPADRSEPAPAGGREPVTGRPAGTATATATLCSFGVAPSTLTVLPTARVLVEGKPAASAQ